MTSRLFSLTFDTGQPERLAEYWSGVLGWKVAETGYGAAVRPPDDTGFWLVFLPSDLPKTGQNRMHFDLTSTSVEDQQATVSRALALGGMLVDVGRLPEEKHVNLGDPDGNEFDVIEPGNNFLAGCGFVGALACDGSQEVGYFWSRALDWPLVWDQDEETAIQSPAGGTKITWGGPPVEPKLGKNRLHFDLVPADGTDQQAEVERLLTLGATRIDIGQGDVDWEVMADPDGNEFCVLKPW